MSDTWIPEYAPWRHGGWYVMNVRYPSGAVGCVSRNYSDGKWRIVCEEEDPGSPTDRTFLTRLGAARAERELAQAQTQQTQLPPVSVASLALPPESDALDQIADLYLADLTCDEALSAIGFVLLETGRAL